MFVKHKIISGATHLRPSLGGLRLRSTRRNSQRGQTIVIALLVLILLAFSGALFITIVTRNLQNARHSQIVSNVDYYAEAGLRFADDQLTFGPDGADWRPPIVRANQVAPLDPDAILLQQRFSRYNFGKGRFLIRITYQPVLTPVTGATTADPLGRYIKIESIGRDGTVDPTDPTTFQHGPAQPLNRTLVAYKAIGITDFARFETNPDNRSDVMNLGVSSINNGSGLKDITTPGVVDFVGNNGQTQAFSIPTQLGSPDAYIYNSGTGTLLPNPEAGFGKPAPPSGTFEPGGGSIFANGTVRFYGYNQIFLSRPSTSGVAIPSLDETLQSSGTILLDSFDPSQAPVQGGYDYNAAAAKRQSSAVEIAVNSSAAIAGPSSNPPYLVTPSNSDNTNFSTFLGSVRDGAMGSQLNDASNMPRGVHRLEPPNLDGHDKTSYLPRYKLVVNSSPVRAGAGAATSEQGYGRSVYIDNTSDIQAESTALSGGATLVDDWLHRSQANWNADFYNPPGVDLDFRPELRNGVVEPRVSITRSDVDSGGNLKQWVGPDGSTPIGQTMKVFFTDCIQSATDNKDIVIYAEGNVRVHGIVSRVPNNDPAGPANGPWHVTIVTNGTAYIDGSLLKGNPGSSIAVLAHDYVCVNTTQFFAGKQSDAPTDPSGTAVTPPTSPSGSQDPVGVTLDPNNSSEELVQEFLFGLPSVAVPKTVTSMYGANRLFLYVSAAADDVTPAQAEFNVWDPSGNPPYNQTLALGAAVTGSVHMTHTTIPVPNLDTMIADQVATVGTRASIDPASIARSNVLLNRVAILPGDVRIEALLFAQTKSFFVIPGPWFNSDKSDSIDQYLSANGATPHNTTQNPFEERFPFFGQPADLKITIYGSVSEARPADIAAQTEWMRHWGWIPQYHGTLFQQNASEVNGHSTGNNAPSPGLTIIYDPLAAYPFGPTKVGSNFSDYYRKDIYGDPLPFAPKLPVCAGLLYTGESSAQSLFQ